MNVKQARHAIVPVVLVILDAIVLILPDRVQRIEGIWILSWAAWGTILAVAIIDLANNKHNQPGFSWINMCMMINSFMLMIACFSSDYFEFTYVWNHSSSELPALYKVIAIWAGDSGSFMLWMLMNAIFIFFYRWKINPHPDDVARVSIATCTAITIVFLVIYAIMDPFEIQWSFVPGGSGLSPSLQSPFMAWHPIFVFLSYAVFVIPFSVTIARMVKPRCTLVDPYQASFFTASLKTGWLVLTLGIGSGVIWAKATMGWGGYWTWDPVETVSLVPWFLCTAYFHAASFQKEKTGITLMNLLLIFTTILFLSLLVRGGGFNSLHAYASMTNLILLENVVGLFALILIFILIYKMIDKLYEESKNNQKLVNNVAYLCLLILAFVTMIGLIVPPLGLLFSPPTAPASLTVNPGYFKTGEIIPATILAISMIFCSLIHWCKIKTITCTIAGSFAVMVIIISIIGGISGIWINPLISIFVLAAAASLLHLIKASRQSSTIRKFLQANGRHVIHAGLALILAGTVSPEGLFQDIVYYAGFFFLIGGILISMLFASTRASGAQAIMAPSTSIFT